jgi:ribosome biogenesis GTPase
MAKKRKIRTDFRKNRTSRSRATDLTRKLAAEGLDPDTLARTERVSGKGELSRRRTIVTTDAGNVPGQALLDVDRSACLHGRVLTVHGLLSTVESEDGPLYKCATRRLLKTLSTDQRHVVAAGDRVLFRPSGTDEGIIERVEPRTSTLERESRGRQHVIVANVDQLLIIASAAEPYIKPNLIDRFLVAAERSGIEPLICINKVDLVEPATLQPLVGVYSQMGYRVLLLSAQTGFGVDRLRRAMAGRQSVVAGQSGVGKSSLLNAIEPGLHLRVASVSQESQKGRHTTTTAQLLRLTSGGYVVDTPGVRQFQLWDLVPEEVASYYRDIRPFVSHCRYPDCTHAHEENCAVKDGVADDLIDARRYESYRHLCEGVIE